MDPSTWTRAVGAPATFDQHCTTVLQRQICRQGARTWQRNTSPNEPRPIFTFSPNSSTGISSRSVSIVLPRPPPILASPTAGALIGGGKATPPRSSSTLMLLSISTTPVPQPAADPHSDAPQVTSPRPRQRARWSSHAAVGARESVAPWLAPSCSSPSSARQGTVVRMRRPARVPAWPSFPAFRAEKWKKLSCLFLKIALIDKKGRDWRTKRA